MSTQAGPGVSGRQRALAWLSMGCALALVLVVVSFTLRNVLALLAVVVGMAIAAAGSWWLVTEHPPRRWFGLAGAVGGLAIVLAAVVGVAADADRPILRVAIVVILFVIMVGAARAAVVHRLHAMDEHRPHVRRAPSHPVLLCNPWSGGGKVDKFGLVELANELGVETVMLDHGLDLEQLARDAIARGADCLGMAGGDGSQALVASIAVECGVPFVCVSAGTRNHFAQDLGIDREDPRNSVYAFRDAVERRIDYAMVNDRFFVNNVSLGVYATIVQQDSYRDAKVETTKSMLPEMLGRTQAPFDLQFTTPDAVEVDGAFLIQVSNNPYTLDSSIDSGQRRRVDTGELGVIALSGTSGKDAAALIALDAVGQRNRSRNWHEFTATTFEVRSRSGTAFAGVDGEALDMETPLVFRIHPGGLQLLVPEGNLEAGEQRAARNVSLGELVDVARGRA
jgi:diacylglycerol kinase family enzyme